MQAWIEAVRSQGGDVAAGGAQSVTPLIEQWDPLPNWHQVGAQLASRGHPLTDAVEWLRLLATAIPSHLGRTLMHPTVLTALASGWAASELRGRPPVADVAPMEVLRVRLLQHFQLADELGVAADVHAALVVIDVGHPGDDRTTATIVHHTREVFNRGETLACSPKGTLLVLTTRPPDLALRTQHLIRRIRADRTLADTPVRVWVEPISKTADHIDAHLHDLAS